MKKLNLSLKTKKVAFYEQLFIHLSCTVSGPRPPRLFSAHSFDLLGNSTSLMVNCTYTQHTVQQNIELSSVTMSRTDLHFKAIYLTVKLSLFLCLSILLSTSKTITKYKSRKGMGRTRSVCLCHLDHNYITLFPSITTLMP